MKAGDGERLIAGNKKAYHDYFVEETFEAGIALTGTEVKSLRENGASLRESFASVRSGEVWLHNVHVAAYSHGNRSNVDPDRARKLLLHKKEIRYLLGKTKERGYTLVPLKIYLTPTNLVKVELGLARGKKLYDKRDAIAKHDQERDVARAMRERSKGE
ncbi:MAG: SsrA-binding protein [Coriobacteriaceae bacterium]|nr:SsrA-binding protein [Coriobacteriaceae bacterium]